ncbi:ATPase [Cellulomonas carbonis T26]|uniref:ATPase n=1 Tax=Cellulomonas carbonis T26 TaxID=947969 RepID=A0A0A0BKE6_9CELL|nr:ATPase [Cellulomonas carbonis T26]
MTASSPAPGPDHETATGAAEPQDDDRATSRGVVEAVRDIADVPAVAVIQTAAVHLMSAAAVKCGLAEDTEEGRGADLADLDEARKLITALAGLVTAAAPEIGSQHARSLRDGLRSLQLAFREASAYPDAPGEGPGEQLTGPVS